VLDYIGRWLGGKFISADYLTQPPADSASTITLVPTPPKPAQIDYKQTTDEMILDGRFVLQDSAPTCAECGMLMTPNGGCYKCENCGSTSGCS
jgi:ribonucleoside-diphosphate reductase alpha chain